jgi:hypothetical protein
MQCRDNLLKKGVIMTDSGDLGDRIREKDQQNLNKEVMQKDSERKNRGKKMG